jgi:hypothetical protein
MFHASRRTEGRADMRRIVVANCLRDATNACIVFCNSTARHREISNKKNVFGRYYTVNPRLVSIYEIRLCRYAEEMAHKPHQCNSGLSPSFECLHEFLNLSLLHLCSSTHVSVELGPAGSSLLCNGSNHQPDCPEEHPRKSVFKRPFILGTLEILRKGMLATSCPSTSQSKWKNSALTGRILMKFYMR